MNRYKFRVENNLCVICGKLLSTDEKTCPECKERRSIKYKEKRALQKAQGICPGCGQKNEGKGYIYCSRCREEERKKNQKKKELNICMTCGSNLREGDRTLCTPCKEKLKVRNKKRIDKLKQEKRCINCKTQLNEVELKAGNIYCKACLKKKWG